MMNPKDAIAKDNATRPENERIPVSLGRGRMSKAANERCMELAAKGWNIKGFAVSKPVSNSPTASEPVVSKTVVVNEKVVSDIHYTFPEDMYAAFYVNGGKAVPGKWNGMREVCNNCHVSLVQCHCGKPSIHNNIPVTIKPRPAKISR